MSAKNKKILSGIALLFIITGLFLYRVKLKWLIEDSLKQPLPQEVNFPNTLADKKISTSTIATAPDNRPKTDTSVKKINKSYNLNVPFTMQAPYSDWSEPWQNTCEEANILMVHYYYQNKKFTKEIAKAELLKLIDWENKNFGSYVDTTVKQTAEIAEKNWNYKTQIIDNPNIDQIKKFIDAGLPVIAPTAGRELKNPYFSNLGPLYHMVTLKGYTEDDKFITNDPGIGRGHDYLYSTAVIMNAMHDWDETDILKGAKRILIIHPN